MPEPQHSKTPFDSMLDLVEWESTGASEVTAVPEENDPDGALPIATHRGVLRIGNMSLEVLQLSNGQRVITEESMANFFGSLGEGED